MEAHPKLRFTPLREKSIRLLKIHPELKDNNVACALNQYDNDFPPYNALSYCWGKSASQDPDSQKSTTRNIYLNNTLISIHETLWEFLDQMQQSGRTEDWIWIDFLCLNQRDHTEMSQQIRRMGDIYSEAKTTISWLGRNRSSEPQQNLEEAFELIASKVAVKHVAVERFFAQPNLNHWTNIRKATQSENHVLDALTLSNAERYVDLPKAIPEIIHLSQGPMMPPILEVLSSPYWERAWVTQEVALAQRVLLMFGEATLDFDEFFLAYRSYFYYMMRQWKPLHIELRVPIEARAAVREDSITFQQVMRWGRDCKASRDVDRIYGLLGLLKRCGDGPDSLPPILTRPIEYSREWPEVYWEIALTYRPLKDTSIVDGDKYREMLGGWVSFVYYSARYFSCPSSRLSLHYATSKYAPQLCKNKARTALRVIDLCTATMIPDFTIRIKASSNNKNYHSYVSSWQTKPGTRQLWSKGESGDFCDFHNLLGALFIETGGSQCLDENEEYQAVYLGLEMLKLKDCEGARAWQCEPRQGIKGLLMNNRCVRFECQVTLPSAQSPGLPCSLNTAISSVSPVQEFHQCKTQDRYLVVQSTGWRLSLEGLRPLQTARYKGIRVGRLTVEY